MDNKDLICNCVYFKCVKYKNYIFIEKYIVNVIEVYKWMVYIEKYYRILCKF